MGTDSYPDRITPGDPMRLALLSVLLLGAAPAAAEVELGFYGGLAGAPAGDVTLGGDAALPDGDAEAGDAGGDRGQAGVRAIWWGDADVGVALDYSRFGDGDGATGEGLTFGTLDSLTLGGVRRWEGVFESLSPYVGAGVGVARAELGANGDTVDATGPAVSWVAGASVPIGENWSVFGEYEGTYVDVEGDMESGGTLGSETVTNSINLGVSFDF
jgi:lipid A oxidase